MKIKSSEFKCPMSHPWIYTRFLNIRISGQFRCDGHWWSKKDYRTATKYISPHVWGGTIDFPQQEIVITLFQFTKPV